MLYIKIMEGNSNDLVAFLLAMQDTVRLYHWQTRQHARHVATCQLLGELSSQVDRLVEAYLGRYERPDFGGELVLRLPTELTEVGATEQLQAYGRWLKLEFPKLVRPHDTDLLNARDEVLGALHQALYRFTLH